MLASTGKEVFDSTDWLYELKLDGYRAIAETGPEAVQLYSRNGLSFLEKYPPLVKALQKIKHSAILDGEIVVLNEKGFPDFQQLQHYEEHPQAHIVYYVFDLLMLNGIDTTSLELVQRKELLKKLVGKHATIRYCDHIENEGTAFYHQVVAQQLEGIMAKKKDSGYHPGLRSKNWLKIKHVQTQEAIIAGFTEPKGSRQYFGALILGQHNGQELSYIGHTGTGFTTTSLRELHTLLQPLITKTSPFKARIKVNAPLKWVKPKIVVEVKFTEMTDADNMRHPVFLRLRPDKNVQEMKSPFTNLDKVFWPKEGYNKGDVINYYDSLSTYILPYLKNRPLSLKRNPNGILDEGFYQKDAGPDTPDWVNTHQIHSTSASKDIDYIICNNKRTLLYLANLGCIEFNPWNSRTNALDKPSYIVLDIDPADKNTFSQVIETALVIKGILDKAGATCYCKTSGATGLHIYVPMGNKYAYEMAKDFAHLVAMLAQEQLPDFTSLERSLEKRGNNIYIDYLQNRSGQTLASAYSLRPRAGATVSTPLEWKEVKSGLLPADFTIENTLRRIQKKGDLFAGVLGTGINLASCLKKLGA